MFIPHTSAMKPDAEQKNKMTDGAYAPRRFWQISAADLGAEVELPAGRDSAYRSVMTFDDLTPDAADLLRSPRNKPQPVADGPVLREVFAARLAMGSPNKASLTRAGVRWLDQAALASSGN